MPNQTDTDSERVSLFVGEQQHDAWEHYSIDSHLLTPADAWRMRLSVSASLPASVKKGAPVTIRVGKNIVMTGRIDKVTDRLDKTTRTVTIQGRDAAAILCDCSAPIFAAQLVTLEELVGRIVKPLGITKIRINTSKTRNREKVNVEPGDTAWKALQNAAEANGLWPWMEPDGTLVVGGPDYTKPPVATLVLRKDGQGNNIESIDIEHDITRSFSDVTVLSQSHATSEDSGDSAIKASYKDPSLGCYRPRIVVDHEVETQQDAQDRTRKLQADSRLASFTIKVQVKGHTIPNSASLWMPGQRVTLISEPHGIEQIYFLIARQFEGGRNTPTITNLELKEDGVWIVEAYPHKRRRGKDSPGQDADVPIFSTN